MTEQTNNVRKAEDQQRNAIAEAQAKQQEEIRKIKEKYGPK